MAFGARITGSGRLARAGLRASLLCAVSVTALVCADASGAFAANAEQCKQTLRGAVVDDCSATLVPSGDNTERNAAQDAAAKPFSISVDGETVDGSATGADAQRKTDVGLDAVDIQVKFDGLDAKQILSVHAERQDDQSVAFKATSNYSHFISKGEIRIYSAETYGGGKKTSIDPVATVDVDENGNAKWSPPGATLRDYVYVLRVYGEDGQFDETTQQSFLKTRSQADVYEPTGHDSDPFDDMTGVRHIPVYGGAVTVFANNVPQGYDVNVMGASVAPDAENKFLFQQILPPGDHDVDIAVAGGKSDALKFTRQVNIPKNDWFYVALADLTVGRRFGDYVESTSAGEYDKTYTKGRLAFYLKGKIKGKYLLTAAGDTGENGDVKDMFKGGSSKSPQDLLRRLDPDDYYPIYGDDSTITEDAPTSGKVYVRLERGESHVMWGNFKTTIAGTTFASSQRALYGAHALYKSETVTSFGEAKTRVEAFAAQPGTVPQRDDFLGTGGSAYFLKRQDITKGSEQIVVERRDPFNGTVVSRVALVEGKDYSIDYVQGVIILTQPLATLAANGGAVVGGALGSDELHLVASYEATPAAMQDLGQTAGGRAEQWLGDNVKIGATALQESGKTETSRKLEADLTLRKSDKTDITFEVAQSEGAGHGQSFSTDGGLTFHDEPLAGKAGQKAMAYSVKARADLEEVTGGALSGAADAYYEFREKGFSAADSETAADTQRFGANVGIKVSETAAVRFGAEGQDSGPLDKKYRVRAETEAEIAENWTLVAGVTWSRLKQDARPYSNGDRIDVGGRLTYHVDEDTSAYVFGQATVARTGNRLNNNRVGVGAETQLTERFGIGGEISYGNTGIGAGADITYKKDADNAYYFGYKLDPDRDIYPETATTLVGTDAGVFVAGANTRLNDWTTAFTESNADLFGKSRKLSQIYGLTFTPDEVWSASLGMSFGTVQDPHASDFDRKAFTARLGYTTEDVKASLNGEVRFEDSADNLRDRTTWLGQADVSWKTAKNWRMIGHVDALFSRSDQSDILNGDYLEASIGAAYRPIDNDKLNLLFKYTYLYDLPGAQQVNADGNVGPSQKSHILSVDATYDINEWLSIGGKYGFRSSEVKERAAGSEFEGSTAHLGIVRADVAVVKNWDLMVEGRVLHAVEAKQTNYGFLAAAYRHFGENMKVGVGYNFGTFSDNIADLTHDDGGVFLNVVGKY